MGMFDNVIFSCPCCNEELTAQSKVGSCNLKNYHQASVPSAIAEDLIGSKTSCPSCEISFIITGKVSRTILYLVDESMGNYDYD